ncbi:MAG: NUDIX domain-containing protein [Candidatus Micrarchaeota archaeon]
MAEQSLLDKVTALRESVREKTLSQPEVDSLAAGLAEAKNSFRPNDSEERFALADGKGNATGVSAPRWLCHLLGLSHLGALCLLTWKNRGLGDCLILQVRSFTKLDFPGCVGFSVGGHVAAGESVEQALWREAREEMGLKAEDFAAKPRSIGRVFDCNEVREKNFFDSEWDELYLTELTDEGVKNIRFEDAEVSALYFCRVDEAAALLQQKHVKLASNLVHLLPFYLKALCQG